MSKKENGLMDMDKCGDWGGGKEGYKGTKR